MLFDGDLAIHDMAEIAIHRQMEALILVLYGAEESIDCNRRRQLLADLADDGLLAALPFLALAAGEFPEILEIALAAFCCQYPIAIDDDGCTHSDRLHIIR